MRPDLAPSALCTFCKLKSIDVTIDAHPAGVTSPPNPNSKLPYGVGPVERLPISSSDEEEVDFILNETNITKEGSASISHSFIQPAMNVAAPAPVAVAPSPSITDLKSNAVVTGTVLFLPPPPSSLTHSLAAVAVIPDTSLDTFEQCEQTGNKQRSTPPPFSLIPSSSAPLSQIGSLSCPRMRLSSWRSSTR